MCVREIKKSWFEEAASFHGVNTLPLADFNLPVQGYWTQDWEEILKVTLRWLQYTLEYKAWNRCCVAIWKCNFYVHDKDWTPTEVSLCQKSNTTLIEYTITSSICSNYLIWKLKINGKKFVLDEKEKCKINVKLRHFIYLFLTDMYIALPMCLAWF